MYRLLRPLKYTSSPYTPPVSPTASKTRTPVVWAAAVSSGRTTLSARLRLFRFVGGGGMKRGIPFGDATGSPAALGFFPNRYFCCASASCCVIGLVFRNLSIDGLATNSSLSRIARAQSRANRVRGCVAKREMLGLLRRDAQAHSARF